MGRIFIVLLFCFLGKFILAKSCCGESSTNLRIISLQQSLNVSTSYSFVDTIGRAFEANSFVRWEEKKKTLHSLNLGVVGSLSERSQVFFNSSYLWSQYQDSIGKEGAEAFSDTQLGYTYEVLPEYYFSYWKPIVYLTFLLNLPTGESFYEGQNLTEGANVTGYNQWGGGLGVTLMKIIFPLKFTLQFTGLKVFAKKFAEVHVSDFYEAMVSFFTFYDLNYQNLSVSGGISSTFTSPRQVSLTDEKSAEVRKTKVTIGAEKSFENNMGIGLSYSDESLLGRAQNTLLNRSFNIHYRYNFF